MIVARRSFPGMGFTYYDLLDSSGREDCDPKDSACVGRNIQRANAVEDLWQSQYMTNPNTANAAVPSNISFKVDNSPAATAAFMNNQPVEASAYVGTTYVPPPAPPPAPAPVPVPTPAPKPAAVINSSGGQSAPAVIQNAQTGTTSSLFDSGSGSGVPWYVWAGGGVLALMVLRGGGR